MPSFLPFLLYLLTLPSRSLILNQRYGSESTLQQTRKFQIKMHFLFWGIFLLMVALWVLVWQVSVHAEAL